MAARMGRNVGVRNFSETAAMAQTRLLVVICC